MSTKVGIAIDLDRLRQYFYEFVAEKHVKDLNARLAWNAEFREFLFWLRQKVEKENVH